MNDEFNIKSFAFIIHNSLFIINPNRFCHPVLGQIPLVQSIREGGDEGIPVMMSDDEISRSAFENFAAGAVRSISMLNANLTEERVAETV